MKIMKEGKKMRILMVEDDEQIREVVKDYFENHAKQYELDCAVSGPEGLKMLREGSYNLLLSKWKGKCWSREMRKCFREWQSTW